MTSDMTGTEVNTNGQLRKRRAHATHVFRQQIKRGRTVIPHGEEKAAASLDSRGKAENKERNGALAQKQALPGTRASRPSDGGERKKKRLNTEGII